jgi:preprotein translocase subunit SecF
MQLIKYRAVWFTISGFLIAASVISLAVWGLKFGIDFTGGSIQELSWKVERPQTSEIAAVFKEQGVSDAIIQNSGSYGTIQRFKDIDETTHAKILSALQQKFSTKDKTGAAAVEEKSFSSIGPAIGNELKTKSIYAVIMVLTAIILYIAWAFRRVSRPVASWKYGVAAVIALTHDVFIPIGVFSILGHYLGYEIDTLFITALLTVLGFSVHDTIVVFDRIRENLLKRDGTFEEIVGFSVKQTIVRSINTSLTVMLVLLAVFFFGGASTKNFVLTLIIGVFFGTYSSIFVASPILVVWNNLASRKAK